MKEEEKDLDLKVLLKHLDKLWKHFQLVLMFPFFVFVCFFFFLLYIFLLTLVAIALWSVRHVTLQTMCSHQRGHQLHNAGLYIVKYL